jgi:hypothetical protein
MISQQSSFSYAVFNLSLDGTKGHSVPVGVALWSAHRQWVKIRLVEDGERLVDFSRMADFPFVNIVRKKINNWIQAGNLPHTDKSLMPFEDAWWEHVRKLLIHRVRLTEAKSIDCQDPELELEPLYNSIVSHVHNPSEITTRIDGHIRDCLGGLVSKFTYHMEIRGFGDKKVKVMRAYHGKQGWVIVDGVNLTHEHAELYSDALASRLGRVISGPNDNYNIIVGYLAPPGGLNGESPLIEWIKKSTSAQVFDVSKEKDRLQHEVFRLVSKVDGQNALDFD